MAANRKYQNISIQPLTVPRSAKPAFELPRQNLSKAELERKSTSDRNKRRVAHHSWFPLPVIREPIVPVKAARQIKPKKKISVLKGMYSDAKSCKVRQIKETVAVVSKATHQSTSSEVDGRSQAIKRKTEDLDSEDVLKKKQKKVTKVDQSKKKDPPKEVDDRSQAIKRKTEYLDSENVLKKKQKKVTKVDQSKKKDPTKGINTY